MHLRLTTAFFLLALQAFVLPALSSAATPTYRIDPVHTRIVFSVTHNEFSRALGTLSGATGTLRFDPDDWGSAYVDVSIPLERLDLGDADWNTRMLKPDFLAIEQQPAARFQSTRIEPIDDDHANIIGNLMLRGETHEVTLSAKLNRVGRNPLTLRRTVGFSATATLSRSALGMGKWKSMIGERIDLIIEVEATRGKARKKPAERAPFNNESLQ